MESRVREQTQRIEELVATARELRNELEVAGDSDPQPESVDLAARMAELRAGSYTARLYRSRREGTPIPCPIPRRACSPSS